MIIAFDVDGTLINYNDKPRIQVIETLKLLSQVRDTKIIVWSGGGKDYAETWVYKLGIGGYVDACYGKWEFNEPVDICFDDEEVKLAIVNIRV